MNTANVNENRRDMLPFVLGIIQPDRNAPSVYCNYPFPDGTVGHFEAESVRKLRILIANFLSMPDFPITKYTVSQYIYKQISDKEEVTVTNIADLTGISRSTIYRYMNGELQNYSRDIILSIGVAIKLTKINLRQFIHAARFSFPETRIDYRIEELLDQGISDYNEIRTTLIEEGLVEDF